MPTQNYAWIWRGSYTWNFLLDFTNPSGKYNYGNWPRGTCHGPYDLGELSILLLIGSNTFSAQFIKTISHDKKIGYNINVMQQTACLVVNPITVGNFAFLFNCTPVGRTSESLTIPTCKLIY